MARPSDSFTRFTPSSPHATQHPSLASVGTAGTYRRTSRQIEANARASPAPESETPAQKVARLRAAARAQREAQYTTTDKLLAKGRRWADIAHRTTAYGLIALTGASALVGAYGLFSLIAHTRREKRAFVEREMNRLAEAQKAFLRGEADAEQLHLLQQERASEEKAAQFKAEQQEEHKSDGVWARLKGVVSKSAAAGDKGQESEAEKAAAQIRKARRQRAAGDEELVDGEIVPVAVKLSEIEGVGFDAKGRPVPVAKTETRILRPAAEDGPVPPRPEQQTNKSPGCASIEHPASNIQHTASNIQHPASNIQHPASNIQHRTSSIEHPASNIQHRTSSIEHPSKMDLAPLAQRAAELSRSLATLGQQCEHTDTHAGIVDIANQTLRLSSTLWRLREAVDVNNDKYTEVFSQDLAEISSELQLVCDEIAECCAEMQKMDAPAPVPCFFDNGRVPRLQKHLVALKTTLVVMRTVLHHSHDYGFQNSPRCLAESSRHVVEEDRAILDSVFAKNRHAIQELRNSLSDSSPLPFEFPRQPFDFSRQPFDFSRQPFDFSQQPFAFSRPRGIFNISLVDYGYSRTGA
ncbi:hypothetical protein DV737_g4244, partial [Chaetothyriales sp. CBS 132003]